MFRKQMAAMLAACVTLGLLAGCGGGSDASSGSGGQTSGSSAESSSSPAGVETLQDSELVSLQAFTTLTFYGQQLYKVELT